MSGRLARQDVLACRQSHPAAGQLRACFAQAHGHFHGSKQDGYWHLKAATEREVHASPDALQQGAQQLSASNVSDAVQQHQRAHRAPAATPCTSSQQVETAAQHKTEALEALTIFVACSNGWSEDSPDWLWLTVAVKQATNGLHNMCSKATLDSLERSSSSPDFAANAKALPGDSLLKRQLSYVDLSGWRREAKQWPSIFDRALPLVGIWLTQAKPKSQLKSIQLKNKQLGVQPAAGAGEAAASHAGQLPTLQPSTGNLAEAGPFQPHGDAQQQPHRGGGEASAPPDAVRTQHRESGSTSAQERSRDTSAAAGSERPRRKAKMPKFWVDFDIAG